MRWFGESWDAPVCEEGEHVETPVDELCEMCGASIEANDQGLMLAYYDDDKVRWFPVHLDCMAKSVTGR